MERKKTQMKEVHLVRVEKDLNTQVIVVAFVSLIFYTLPFERFEKKFIKKCEKRQPALSQTQ